MKINESEVGDDVAAPQKRGLDYYPRDVGVLKDRKFIKAKIKYGYLAIVVYDALLEMVYSDKGYYLDYLTEEEKEGVAWDILDSVRGKYPVEAETIYGVIEMLVECKLFSHDYFKQGIITSKRIQETYYKCTVERKNVKVDPKIWLLDIDEMKAISVKSSILSFFVNCLINEVNQPNNGDNQSNNSQNKVEEIKGEENKGERQTPTLEDIRNYCEKNGYKYDYVKFYQYYEANGWMIKGNPIVNWKAKLDCWYKEDMKKSDGNNITMQRPKGVFNNYTQRIYSEDEIAEILKRKKEKISGQLP